MKIIQKYIEIIARKRLRQKHKKTTSALIAKEIENTKVEYRHIVRDSLIILLGILSASFGLRGFLLPNAFLDGGVTGISLIASELSGIPLSFLIVAINIPFMLMAYSTVNPQFALKSIGGVVLLAFAIHFIPFPTVTSDKLLIASFGGFFLGLGIGLAIRGGSVIDGTEVLAVYLSKKTHLSIGDIILIFNILIFSFAAYVFTIEIALYAILTYLVAAKTVNFIVSGVEEYVGVTIISDKSDEIRTAIIEKLGRGCTIYDGKKGLTQKDGQPEQTQIIYTLLTRLEIPRLQTEIDKIDKEAFIVMHSIKDAKGGMIKKRPLK